MDWLDNLRPASFRGVPFFVDTSQFTTGRRVQLHEFPDRVKPFPEDLGKVADTFRVDGHILGDDYFTQKKNLIAAVQTEGPGELIHPYYGTLNVQCGPVSFDEDTKQGRIAKVTFTFYESGSDAFPKNVDDKPALLNDAADAGLLSSKAAFDEEFSILKQPGFVVDAARDKIAQVEDFYNTATAEVAAAADTVAELAFSIRKLVAETEDLLQAPALLSQRLQDSFNLLTGALGASDLNARALSAFFTFGDADPIVIGATPSRDKERENDDLFDDFMKRSALFNAVKESILIEFESADEALVQRAELLELLEVQLEATTDDQVYQDLQTVKARVAELLPDVDNDLPSIQAVELPNSINSLSLAYDLFEVLEAEDDIIKRNNIRHPGFILGGSTVQVLDVRAGA